MRILAAAVASAVGLSMLLTACGRQPDSAPATRPQKPVLDFANRIVAGPVHPDPRVAAIFFGGSDLHGCTGAVVHSATGDLALTAAHCLGPGISAALVPGFAGKAEPADTWTVDQVYLDPRWMTARDPRADYAIVRVSRPDGGSIETQVGSALSLGAAPAAGSTVSIIAYLAGVGGKPIGCQASTRTVEGYPELPCAGLADGTSGAPWISGSTVVGVIGGLHGGGCAENLSYSAPFDEHTTDLLTRAEAGGPGDVPPPAFNDEC
jgi:hypothetical protein